MQSPRSPADRGLGPWREGSPGPTLVAVAARGRPEAAQFEQLAQHECWRLLRSCRHGRLAFTAADGRPDVRPVNHVVDGGSLVVRTHAGGSLVVPDRGAAVLREVPVAYEVDGVEGVDGDDGTDRQDHDQPGREWLWSVVLRGRASLVDGLEGALEVLDLPLEPFWSGAGHVFLRLSGTVTGRRLERVDPAGWHLPSTVHGPGTGER